ncbi:glycosyltransferase family 2 protein [Candidatus Poribacteria bacterium]|nr:glycosyltransferase family 2 protein [Candidatus Poribacteria bacterium]
MNQDSTIEVSVVMPCLNEQQTIGSCIEKAKRTMKSLGIRGEVVVADNGSTDNSVSIAENLGARVVHQPIRGYGAAYQAGIEATRGNYIIIGDSDDTYDFTDLERFLTPLRNGHDLVMGSRFKGEILPGAMPWSHRYIGNPILSGILRWVFHTSISDAHCGMRAFTRQAYDKMQLQTTGMEFASEMVVKAAQAGLKISETPITYYPRLGESKLNSFRDAWRHLRFMLLFSPTHLFALPGALLFLLGMFGLLMMLPGPVKIGTHVYDIHVMTLAGFVALLGYQILHLSLYARTYAVSAGFVTKDKFIRGFYQLFTLERGIAFGALLFLCGVALDIRVAWTWIQNGFGSLDEILPALFALVCMILGVQTMFSAFLLSLFAIPRQGKREEGITDED